MFLFFLFFFFLLLPASVNAPIPAKWYLKILEDSSSTATTNMLIRQSRPPASDSDSDDTASSDSETVSIHSDTDLTDLSDGEDDGKGDGDGSIRGVQTMYADGSKPSLRRIEELYCNYIDRDPAFDDLTLGDILGFLRWKMKQRKDNKGREPRGQEAQLTSLGIAASPLLVSSVSRHRKPAGEPYRPVLEFSPQLTKKYLMIKDTITSPIPEILFNPVLALSSHVLFLGVLFDDQAFRTPGIWHPNNLDQLDINHGYNSLAVPLKKELDDYSDINAFLKLTAHNGEAVGTGKLTVRGSAGGRQTYLYLGSRLFRRERYDGLGKEMTSEKQRLRHALLKQIQASQGPESGYPSTPARSKAISVLPGEMLDVKCRRQNDAIVTVPAYCGVQRRPFNAATTFPRCPPSSKRTIHVTLARQSPGPL
ncbi:hypothetical protein BDY21DRAFT_424719 [Lineolata rhizophorae]|uniref:Uncharacterized protein n=1 Tax=Lineolata rhizophorae TaxID=578093 RepID=A0A6A6NP76_9PEZI|nr:hypothetical protein BDY21DRAFT_424719 [Lineolata rhizophorae]